MFRKIFLTSVFVSKLFLIFALALFCQSCVSRREYRNRMDSMSDIHTKDWQRVEREIYKDMRDLQIRIEFLEKKMDERREPCVYFSTSIVCHEQERPRLKYIPEDIVDPQRSINPIGPQFIGINTSTKSLDNMNHSLEKWERCGIVLEGAWGFADFFCVNEQMWAIMVGLAENPMKHKATNRESEK